MLRFETTLGCAKNHEGIGGDSPVDFPRCALDKRACMKRGIAFLGSWFLGLAAVPLLASPEQGVVEPIEVRKGYASAGDPAAQFNLGIDYAKGESVPKDSAASLQWFRKSAQSGFAPAQLILGVLYAEGGDVPRDDREALKWLSLAGQQGLFEAQTLLISFYSEGRGTPKNPAAALTWDFFARRTLELRHEQPAGEPPHPPALRKDGTAEIVMKDGSKKILQPGGGEESARADGAKVVTFLDGTRKITEPDGTETTERPSGFAEIRHPDGRKSVRDPNGTMKTTYPDGRNELRGPGKDSRGRAVVLTESFDKEGKKTGRVIVRGDVTIRENETGPFVVETVLKDQNGVAVRLKEAVRPDGKYGRRMLTRLDTGEEPKGTEVWTIQRNLEQADGSNISVEETYSALGLGEQRVVRQTPAPSSRSFIPGTAVKGYAPRTGDDSAIPMKPASFPGEMPAVPITVIGTSSGMGMSVVPSDENILKEVVKLGPMLKQLEELEYKGQHFAGATEANWKSAKATAASYVIPLANVPQQKGATSAWFLARQMSGSKMLDVPFLPATHDFSQQFPFGVHGREVIGRHRWVHAQTPHFIVHYLSESDAKLSMHYIEFAYSAVVGLLGLDPQRGAQKGHVFLFSSDAQWQAYLAQSHKDPRLGGFAYKNELLMPVVASHDSSKTLCHEVTHAIVSRFYPGAKPPLWLNEGFAEYVAALTLSAKSGNPVDKYMSSKADRPMNVGDVFHRVRYGGNSVFSFYANSAWCVRTLCEKLPADGFPRFFNAVTAGNSSDVAFRVSYGVKCPGTPAFAALANSWDFSKAGGSK